MEFLVIAYSFLAFILIVLLASPAGQRMDKKQKRIERINNSVGQPIYKELELSFYERFLGKGIKGVSAKISKFLPQKKNANKTNTLEAIRKQLRYAGIFMEPSDFQFIKYAFLVGALFLTLVIMLVVKTDTVETTTVNDSILTITDVGDNLAGCILNQTPPDLPFASFTGAGDVSKYSRNKWQLRG